MVLFLLAAFYLTAAAEQESGEGTLIAADKGFRRSLLSLMSLPAGQQARSSDELLAAHPVECDWLCRDTDREIEDFFKAENQERLLYSAISKCLEELSGTDSRHARRLRKLKSKGADAGKLIDLYVSACELRRAARLENIRREYPRIVFVKNVEVGNAPRGPMSLSNGPWKGKPFHPGSAICMLDLSKPYRAEVTLLEDPGGMIRDPDVSFDGRRILFSWKKSATQDDYHLYEMTVRDRSIRQITSEPGVADIQGRYVPGGIVYHSSRCVNVVVCNETIDTVNMYRCDLDGGNIRRLTYDQVSTQYPSVLQDGRIVYTRWEYNDRGQIYPQGLFAMNPDGTAQVAVYGNNSWYPTSLIQARGIPGSNKLVTVLAGHHTPPCGKLALVDLTRGQDEGLGVELVAPRRAIKYERLDHGGQDDVLFQHPYPLNEDEYIVGFSVCGRRKSRDFGIYYMRSDGARELLTWDKDLTARQPVPLVAREAPNLRPNLVDSDEDTGVFYVDNVYKGEGLRGVEKGMIKKLRVIGLDFRAAAVGISFNSGPAGNARVDTPVSIGGAWDTKIVLGDAEVYDDGSASFVVPARMPVYFQAIDAKGRAVQSMRSWSTLQGGEALSCIGCHVNRNQTPQTARRSTIAQAKGPQELADFYGPARGFSYLKEVQPILDRHCVSCHHENPYRPPVLSGKSGEGLYCFWPAQYRRTNIKHALYHFAKPQDLGQVSIRWLKKGHKALREPSEWKLLYRKDGNWRAIEPGMDAENIVLDEGVVADTLMVEAVVAKGASGGIAQWHVFDSQGKEIDEGESSKIFNLSGRKVYEELSGRAWAESYLSLLRAGFRNQGSLGFHLAAYPNEFTQWISPQSGPAVMKPYSFGAAKSGLIEMLDAGHENVELSVEEMDKLACWLDLAVPYCGQYDESNIWTEQNILTYAGQLEERARLSKLEMRH
jgi:hypothetical protein